MQERLEELGLNSAEAAAYFALVENGGLTARQIAERAGVARSSVYPMLASLADKGLIESGAGRGATYHAISPERGLALLIDRERENLARRVGIAEQLAADLSDLHDRSAASADEIVEVLRDRRVIAERYDRLQLEAQSDIDTIVKAPMIVTLHGNPAAETALEQGIRTRGLY